MKMSPGCRDLSGYIVILNQSLDGLKQAARVWHLLLVSNLVSTGFEEHPSELCVITLVDSQSNEVKAMTAVYVEDIILAASDNRCDCLCNALSKIFPANNLGPRPGIGGVFLSQIQ